MSQQKQQKKFFNSKSDLWSLLTEVISLEITFIYKTVRSGCFSSSKDGP